MPPGGDADPGAPLRARAPGSSPSPLDRAPDSPQPDADDERDLHLVGFLTFVDRPKADAGESIAKLDRLGIAVKIITGDNGTVAAKVCRDIGLDRRAES